MSQGSTSSIEFNLHSTQCDNRQSSHESMVGNVIGITIVQKRPKETSLAPPLGAVQSAPDWDFNSLPHGFYGGQLSVRELQ